MNAVIKEVAKGEDLEEDISGPDTKIMAMTCTYRHPSLHDNNLDNEVWFGPQGGAEDMGEDAGEEEAVGDC